MTEYFGRDFRPEFSALRKEVFMGEQGFDYDTDSRDTDCYHACIYGDDGNPVAVGRAFAYDKKGEKYKFGRIAVKKSCRKGGMGRKVMTLMERNAKLLGAEQAVVSAQVRAQGFYEKVGYTATGAIYDEDGVPHIKMVKKL